jgi:hypothetical protein
VTLKQIESEIERLPVRDRARLLKKLILSLDDKRDEFLKRGLPKLSLGKMSWIAAESERVPLPRFSSERANHSVR